MATTSARGTLTKSDLIRIEALLKKAVNSKRSQKIEKEYLDILNLLVDTVHQLKVTVEFDHEERLRALEDFLKEP